MSRPVIQGILGFIFFVTSSIFGTSQASAQWQQTSGPKGREIVDLFSTGDTAYAATGGGVYRSVDGATSWQLIGLAGRPVNHIWGHGPILLAAVVDSAIGVYRGCDVYRSPDGGATWNIVTNGLQNNVVFLWAFGAQNNTLYISASLVNLSGFTMLRSSDDGLSWAPFATGLPPTLVTGFASAGDTLFASTYADIFVKSADSITWRRVAGITHPLVATSIYYDGSTLYSGTSDGVYTSTDRGATWTLNVNVIEPRRFASFYGAGNASATVIADDSINYYTSNDHGVHWSFLIQNQTISHLALAAIQATPTSGKFLAGSDDHIYSLQSPFQNLVESDSGIINADAYSLQFINGTLYAATASGFESTKDGGATWTSFTSNGNPGTVSLIAHLGTVIVVGGTGLYRTSNEGISWDTLHGGPSNFQTVTALGASNTRLYAGANGFTSALFTSSDSGSSWHQTDTAITGIIYSIYVQDSLVLVFTSSEIDRSVDNGVTWSSAQNLTYYSISAQMLAGNGTVVLTSANGLARSIDGGITWRQVKIPITDPSLVESVSMSGNLAFAGTKEGVFFSLDTGLTWKPANDGFVVPTIGIAFDGTYIYAGTLGSSVWKGALATVGVSELRANAEEPTLSNYPNPFHANTTIEFSTVKLGHVTLELYDALGRRIETLFDRDTPAGTHTIQFNSAGLGNGVYFACLHSADGLKTLPMTVSK